MEQIQMFITQVKNKWPDYGLNILIEKLYQFFFILKQKYFLKKSQHTSTKLQKSYGNAHDNIIIHIDQLQNLSLKKRHIQITNKNYIQSNGIIQLMKYKNQRQKQLERKIVALAFCNRGYGIPKLRQQQQSLNSQIKIPQKRYNSVSCTVVTEAFRRAQSFLILDCKKKLQILNSSEIKILYTDLFNYKQVFSQPQIQTYIKFLKLAYDLQVVTIDEDEAEQFYSRCLNLLRRKINRLWTDKANKLKVPQRLNKIKKDKEDQSFWTKERELQFYDEYIKEESLRKMRDNFRIRYRNINNCQNLNSSMYIQSSISRIKIQELQFSSQQQKTIYDKLTNINFLNKKYLKSIRQGVHKIKRYTQNNPNLPQLHKISENLMKSILGSEIAKYLRISIIKFLKLDKIENQSLSNLINQINQFAELINLSKLNKNLKDPLDF